MSAAPPSALEAFAFTPENEAAAEAIVARYPAGRQASAVLALLTPLVMTSLALRAVTDSATTVALVVAVVVAAAGRGLPFDLGSVGAGVAGVLAGTVLDVRRRSKRGPTGEVSA